MNTQTSSYDYDQQATDFLSVTGTKISFSYIGHDYHFVDDKDTRDIWMITLRNSNGVKKFRFGQSIANRGEQPSAYDFLAAVVKSDPGAFEEFCSDFRYDLDSRKAENIYKGVVREWAKITALFSQNDIETLQNIA